MLIRGPEPREARLSLPGAGACTYPASFLGVTLAAPAAVSAATGDIVLLHALQRAQRRASLGSAGTVGTAGTAGMQCQLKPPTHPQGLWYHPQPHCHPIVRRVYTFAGDVLCVCTSVSMSVWHVLCPSSLCVSVGGCTVCVCVYVCVSAYLCVFLWRGVLWVCMFAHSPPAPRALGCIPMSGEPVLMPGPWVQTCSLCGAAPSHSEGPRSSAQGSPASQGLPDS